MGTEQKVVKLSVPITVEASGGGQAVISEVKIGRIRAKHLEFMPQSALEGKATNPAKMFPLIAAVTGLSKETLGELDFLDFTAVVEAVTAQLGEGVASGQNGGS